MNQRTVFNRVSVVLAGAVLFGLSGLAWGTPEREGKDALRLAALETGHEDLLMSTGKVASLDIQRQVLQLQTLPVGTPAEFEVGSNPEVRNGDQRFTLSQLKAGDEVEIQYSVEDGKRVARTIQVMEGESAKPRG